MKSTSNQKRQPKNTEDNLDKKESEEIEENDVPEETEAKEEKPKTTRKPTKDIRRLLSYSIDPYDAPLMWWESKHVRYAINYPPVKRHLRKLMGSHVVRLTDYKYMQKLAAAIAQDYIEQQKIRIEKRKLKPPSIISRLLEISYKALSEKIRNNQRHKIKLYV